LAILRAIARRTVIRLSWKWRSGRDWLRDVGHRPSGRGGKSPRTFGDDERVAGKYDRDVMVPARATPALVVVEPDLTFEDLVNPLCAPALHDDRDELLARHFLGSERAKEVVRG